MNISHIIVVVTAVTLGLSHLSFAQTKKTTTKTSSSSKTTKSSSTKSSSTKSTSPTNAPAAPSTPAPTEAPAPASTAPAGTSTPTNSGVSKTPSATPSPAPSTAPAQAPAPAATPALTPSLASSGLQEALIQGIKKGVEIVSKTDGYLGNPLIKIPFPQEFSMVEGAVRKIGLGNVADQAVTSMNRAAEQAASDALPIFLDAIKQLNFTDVMSILSGSNDRAATDFLQRTTSDQLVQKFKPTISDALGKVEATRYWGQIMGAYNQIPLVQKVNPDLPDYVTKRAIEGLFTMVAQEEKNIRQNPVARTTDVLQQVFGGITKSTGIGK